MACRGSYDPAPAPTLTTVATPPSASMMADAIRGSARPCMSARPSHTTPSSVAVLIRSTMGRPSLRSSRNAFGVNSSVYLRGVTVGCRVPPKLAQPVPASRPLQPQPAPRGRPARPRSPPAARGTRPGPGSPARRPVRPERSRRAAPCAWFGFSQADREHRFVRQQISDVSLSWPSTCSSHARRLQ